MEYELRKVQSSEKEILYNYKILSILDFNNTSSQEKEKISNYITNLIDNHINDYKLILINGTISGCYCSYIKENYIFIDEIYIEEKYRNLGIGTSLLKREIEYAKTIKKDIKLWVYKINESAIKLYKKFKFIVDTETETRYLMKLIVK